MKPQRFVTGNADASEYLFPGALINMRASAKQALIDIAIESAMVYRALLAPDTTMDMFFSFRGSMSNIWVFATTSPLEFTYTDVTLLGEELPKTSRFYTYTGLSSGVTYFGWLAGRDSFGQTIVPRFGPFEGVSTADSLPPNIASATATLSGLDINMLWSVTDNVKATDIWVLKTTDAGDKTNFDIISAGVTLADTATSYTFTGNTEGAAYYMWLACRDAAGNYTTTRTTPSSLTPDQTAPIISSATMSLTNNRDVATNFTVTDNVSAVNIYTYITTDSAAQSVATIIASGTQLAGTATSNTFSKKDWGTTYYGWVAAKDAAGNQSVATRCNPRSVTTTGPDITTGLFKQKWTNWKFNGSGTLDASEHTVSIWGEATGDSDGVRP